MYCAKCGVELPEKGKFCPKCGHKILGVESKAIENEMKKEVRHEDKRLRIVIGIAIIAIVCLVLFSYSNKMRIVGTWKSQGRKALQFQKDGTFVSYDPVMGTTVYGNGSWKLSGNDLTITHDNGKIEEYTVSINGGEMVMERWDSAQGDYREAKYVRVE